MVLKLRRQVGATHQETVEMASANMVLARQRLIEGTTSWTQKPPASTAQALNNQDDLQRAGTNGDDTRKRKFEHGGPYRVFCSMWLQERHLNNEDVALAECAAAYRKLREEGGDRWQELLAAGARAASLPEGTSFAGGRPSQATQAGVKAIKDAVSTKLTQGKEKADARNDFAIVSQAIADLESQQKEELLSQRLRDIQYQRQQAREADSEFGAVKAVERVSG